MIRTQKAAPEAVAPVPAVTVPTLASAPEESSAPERLHIKLTKGAGDTLEYLVRATGKSKTDVVRDALFLERYAQEAWSEGGKVIVQRGREKREVIPH